MGKGKIKDLRLAGGKIVGTDGELTFCTGEVIVEGWRETEDKTGGDYY